MKPMLDFLARFMEPTEDEIKIIIGANREKHYAKNEIVKNAAEVTGDVYFVLAGGVYSRYGREDDQVVGDFFFEGDPVIMPPLHELRCLEPTTLAVSSEAEGARLLLSLPRFERVCRLFAEERLARSMRLADQLKGASPSEKYKFVMNERPELIQKVPQYLLASFLGMAPETLSRVRGLVP